MDSIESNTGGMQAWFPWRVSNVATEELGMGRGIWFGSIFEGAPGPNWDPERVECPITGGTGAICWPNVVGGGIPNILGGACMLPASGTAPWNQMYKVLEMTDKRQLQNPKINFKKKKI